MTITDILAMCPTGGKSDSYEALFADSVETSIDKAMIQLIKSAEGEMKGFYCGIYAAYVSMTTCDIRWEDIRFMISAASEWDEESINSYKGEAS